jgi:hypothetical protein
MPIHSDGVSPVRERGDGVALNIDLEALSERSMEATMEPAWL